MIEIISYFVLCRKSYAYKKLEEKGGSEIGCYLLRESEMEYDEYYIDLVVNLNAQEMEKIHTFKIYKDENDFFYSEDGSYGFPSTAQLLAHFSKEININFSRCIPPSEYGKELFFYLHNAFVDIFVLFSDRHWGILIF